MIYSEKEIEILREGGKRLAVILEEVSTKALVGVKISDLNELAENLIKAGGDTPAFLNYRPEGVKKPYPASLCVSVNDEVVHGISTGNDRELQDGDVVGLDLGLVHKGLITDTAVTVGVGEMSDTDRKLIETTEKALYKGIKEAKAGNRTGDIGFAISESAKPSGFGIVEDLGGHGVGKSVHEEPFIPNFGKKGTGDVLREGMVIALEPMLNEGTKKVFVTDDRYTFKTGDGKKSAHFEHTILVTDGEPEILTKK